MEYYHIIILLVAALCHALWNAIIKSVDDADKSSTSVIINSAAALLFAMLYFFIPDGVQSPFERIDLIAIGILSGDVNCSYWLVLPIMYKRMDISQGYPIARGTSPILVAIFAFILIDDRLSTMGIEG